MKMRPFWYLYKTTTSLDSLTWEVIIFQISFYLISSISQFTFELYIENFGFENTLI